MKNSNRISVQSTTLFRSLPKILITSLLFVPFLFLQAQNSWPKLYVAYYDCNSTGAATADENQQKAIYSCSKLIYKEFLKNKSDEINFFSYGFSDTTVSDLATSRTSFYLPDSGVSPNLKYDFVISSKITGNPGSYTLTVSILDGYSYSHVADGVASFNDATDANVQIACHSAVQQLLPFTDKMRNFLKTLKQKNSKLLINPRIEVSPALLNLSKNGSTNVVINTIDCDGLPISNRELTIETTRGSFTTSTIQTDENGHATVNFNAGASEGLAKLTATIQDAVLVTHDTLSLNGTATIIVGDIDTANLWVLDFDLSRSYSGYKDEITEDMDGVDWTQKNGFWTQHSYGTFLATPNGESNTEFDFSDTSLSVTGMYFQHNFQKSTYTDRTGNNCPKVSWTMSGDTKTWEALTDENTGGNASFSYDPTPYGMNALPSMYHLKM